MVAFRAMNTDVTVTATGVDEEVVAALVARTFAEAERRFSRFLPDSELARLNRARGPVTVSPPMFDALVRARAYRQLTGGLFDPAMGGPLAALGYDRSFAPGVLDRDHAAAPPGEGSFREVRLDAATRTVERPEHVQIDLGGLVKGATVDAAARLLPAVGAIEAGGDAVMRGPGPAGDGWQVEIEDPAEPTRTLAVLRVRSDGAVATSAPNRRRWRVAGRAVHHLIDPRTRAPAASDLLQATVLAPRAELADVLAKTTFLLGAEAAHRFLAGFPGVAAVLVRPGGALVVVGQVAFLEVDDR
jgi:FAD:protein FMN transferase